MPVSPHFLVTAGNTREAIDRVRDWGNIFTGRTGFEIAQALLQVGAVTLLTSVPAHAEAIIQAGGQVALFRTHQELETLCAKSANQLYQAVIMTAAISDYEPDGVYEILERQELSGTPGVQQWTVRNVQRGKVKSTHRAIAVAGKPTAKIVDMFRSRWNYRGLLIKFKLEVDLTDADLIQVAAASRLSSQADLMVANSLAHLHGAEAKAFLIDDHGVSEVKRAALAATLVTWIETRLRQGPG
ncbi:MAG: phosphopantothenoylcysteine decarboxylase [Phycisphaerae bacterium]